MHPYNTQSTDISASAISINTQELEFFEEQSDHHYRTEIPNVIFDIGLNIYELAVYTYIKRIASDTGKCWKSIPNIAKALGIGITKTKEALASLQTSNNKLKHPLIKKNERLKADGSRDSNVYCIVNIWPLNGKYYAKKNGSEGGSPHDGGVGRHTTGGGSPHDYKEDLKEERKTFVVGGTPPLLVIENSKNLTKEELYHQVDRLKRDWSNDEINSAYEKFCTTPKKITSPIKYIEGIINNIRMNATKNNSKNSSQNKCYNTKSMETKTSKKPSGKDNIFISAKDMPDSYLATYVRRNGLM